MVFDSSKTTRHNNQVAVHLVGLFAMVVLYPAWYWIIQTFGQHTIDSFWNRVLIVIPGIFLTIFHFLSPQLPRSFQKKWPQILNWGCTLQALLLNVQYFHITAINHMHPIYSVGAFIVIFSMCAILNDPISLLIVSLESIALSIWASQSVEGYYRTYFIAAVGTALLIGTTATLSRLKLIRLEREARQKISQQQEALLTATRLAAAGEMSGGVAHEINTPLATLVLNIALIRQKLAHTPAASAILADVESIEKTTHRIGSIVKGLLAFSPGGGYERSEPVSISELIHEAVQMCTFRLTAEHILLQIQCPAHLEAILIRNSLLQSLYHLLNNAIDAVASQDDGKIQIQAQESVSTIEISVTDNGPGIPHAVAKKIFLPFFTTKSVGQGTGLGLSITQGLVEKQGGSLNFISRPGQTRFMMTFKRHA